METCQAEERNRTKGMLELHTSFCSRQPFLRLRSNSAIPVLILACLACSSSRLHVATVLTNSQ